MLDITIGKNIRRGFQVSDSVDDQSSHGSPFANTTIGRTSMRRTRVTGWTAHPAIRMVCGRSDRRRAGEIGGRIAGGDEKMSGLDYVLHDGTPVLRLPDGTGLSREDCLRWSKLLRKAAADLKRPAFQSVSYVRVDGLAVRVKAFRDNGKTSEHVFRCSRSPRLDDGWVGLLHDLPAIAQDDGTGLLAWLAEQSENHIANWQLMAEAVGYEPAADYTEFEDWAEDPTLKTVEGAER